MVKRQTKKIKLMEGMKLEEDVDRIPEVEEITEKDDSNHEDMEQEKQDDKKKDNIGTNIINVDNESELIKYITQRIDITADQKEQLKKRKDAQALYLMENIQYLQKVIEKPELIDYNKPLHVLDIDEHTKEAESKLFHVNGLREKEDNYRNRKQNLECAELNYNLQKEKVKEVLKIDLKKMNTELLREMGISISNEAQMNKNI